MKLDLGRPRTVQQLLADSARVYFANSTVLLSISAIGLILTLVRWVIPDVNNGWEGSAFLTFSSFIITPYVTGALIAATNDAFFGVRPDRLRALRSAGDRLVPLITTYLLAVVLMVMSLVAFPYFLVRWQFTEQAVMIDDKRRWSALDRSSALVRGDWWRVFWILLLTWSWAIALSVVASVFSLRGSGRQPTFVYGIPLLAVGIRPYLAILTTLLYYDLRARNYEPLPAAEGAPASI